MKLLSLKDNALFLRNCRERLRSHNVLASGVLLGLVIFLIFVTCQLNPTERYVQSPFPGKWDKEIVPPLHMIFWFLSILQGVVLLFFGSISVNRMAGAEKNSGTLDFHRASPTSRGDQMIGLVLGGAVLEWVLFAVTLMISAVLVLFCNFNIGACLKFYVSLIFCAVFFHAAVALLALSQMQKGSWNAGRAVFVFLLVAMLYGMWFNPAAYHMTFMPAYSQWQEVLGVNSSSYREDYFDYLKSFWGIPVDALGFQLVVQIALLAFLGVAIQRKIFQPQGPLLTKSQCALLSILLMFFLVGGTVSLLAEHYDGRHRWDSFYYTTLSYVIFVLGFLGVLLVTPSHLSFVKGVRRQKKLSQPDSWGSADASSNALWLMVFGMAAFVMYALVFYYFNKLDFNRLLAISILLFQVLFFGRAYECYQLSAWHQKKSLFWTGIGILWVIAPLFGQITKNVFMSPPYEQFFLFLSPFFTAQLLSNSLALYPESFRPHPYLDYGLAVNLTLCLSAFYIAYRQRRKLEKRVLAEIDGHPS